MRYVDSKIVFSEIPDEITLAINISNCPIHCRHCHSKYLWADIGTLLNINEINRLLVKNSGITCICFMGGDSDVNYLNNLAKAIKTSSNYDKFPIKLAWYSGQDSIDTMIDLEYWDYIKIGPYIQSKGPLNNPNTNQRLYRIDKLETKWELIDITNRFWKH